MPYPLTCTFGHITGHFFIMVNWSYCHGICSIHEKLCQLFHIPHQTITRGHETSPVHGWLVKGRICLKTRLECYYYNLGRIKNMCEPELSGSILNLESRKTRLIQDETCRKNIECTITSFFPLNCRLASYEEQKHIYSIDKKQWPVPFVCRMY